MAISGLANLPFVVTPLRVAARPEPSIARAAFDQQIEPMLPRLHRLCLALAGDEDTANDVLQSALVKAWLRWDQHDGRGDRLHWLFGICRHEHFEQLRTARRRRGLLSTFVESGMAIIESFFSTEAQRETPEDAAQNNDDAAALLAALATLPEDQRAVVAMCDIDDLSYAEVASVLNVPIGTVKSRHARGRKRLAAILEPNNPEPHKLEPHNPAPPPLEPPKDGGSP